MAKKMLIDTTHPEETRVVVVDGSRVEEFDYESITKLQISGNIYLAKVTRVEPSLQAAFVEYGGGRHGFLAFSEVHPDYYQIPVADREALIEAERAAAAEEALEEEDGERRRRGRRNGNGKRAEERRPEEDGESNGRDRRRRGRRRDGGKRRGLTLEADPAQTPAPEKLVSAAALANGVAPAFAETPSRAALTELAERRVGEEGLPDLSDVAEIEIHRPATPEEQAEHGSEVTVESIDLSAFAADAPIEDAEIEDADVEDAPQRETSAAEAAGAPLPATVSAEAAAETDEEDDLEDAEDGADDDEALETSARGAGADEDGEIEEIGADDARDEIQPRRVRMRDYRIQEVIKRRQIMLVQVVKEERGTKGAALTTYLSLAGRYCVLMPNTARGGGISRKITNAADRKRLKAVAQELEVPEGMGLIVRTAGANRTKAEIKRDFEYLLRQWSAIRDLTLSSVAPALIYEEGSLIKRAIRDLYNKDIDAVLVEGEEGYREAKDYMKMLMPSHAKNVQPYRERAPLFMRFQVENQIGAMMNPTVPLKSGGYLVIGVTEALVAIDVNSGRSTKEGSIEETALKTNLEAAEEAARQMRLRDLAGLIVIDFIDMEDPKNNRAVEKRLKDKLKNDRARIQVGRISGFGLLEMSRQRLRPGLLEATTVCCPHCKGVGVIRSAESMALTILRAVEEEGVRGKTAAVRVGAPVQVANYLMNHKRARIAQIEERYELQVLIEGDAAMVSPDFATERVKPIVREEAPNRAIQVEAGFADLEDAEIEEEIDEAEEIEVAVAAEAEPNGEAQNGRRRRRRRGRGRDDGEAEMAAEAADGAAEAVEVEDEDEDDEDDEAKPADIAAEGGEEDGDQPRRRRGRRGGRRRRKKSDESDPLPMYDLADGDGEETAEEAVLEEGAALMDAAPAELPEPEAAEAAEEDGEEDREDDREDDDEAPVEVLAAVEEAPAALVSGDAPPPEEAEEPADRSARLVAAAARAEAPQDPNEPRRTGWWSFRRG